MKKAVVLVAVFVITVFNVNAQSKSDKMYEAFSEEEGVASFSFSKSMIDAVNIDLGEKEDRKNVSGDLHQVRFMAYNPDKGDLSGPAFCKKAIDLLPSKYKKYEEKDEKDTDTEIRLLGKRKHFSECHLFITNKQENQMSFVVSFYGNFTVNDLDNLKETGRSFSDKE